MANGRHVAYYRVSTKHQDRTGHGLEAQRTAVAAFLNGGNWQLVGEFTEVESGKRDDNRPQLQAALDTCRATGATLVISKLDRLSRDAHFLLGLQKAGVPFVCADMPSATELTVGIMALLAQEERKMISKRTKEALAAAKSRGVLLGNPDHLTEEARAKGRPLAAASKNAKANQTAEQRLPFITARQTPGKSLRTLAAELNAAGILSPSGRGSWSAASVSRVLARAARNKKNGQG